MMLYSLSSHDIIVDIDIYGNTTVEDIIQMRTVMSTRCHIEIVVTQTSY